MADAKILGVILIILGLILVAVNYMNFITSDNVMQQGIYSTKTVANWLMVITGILIIIAKK